ncbi:MAG: Wzz/FepE/Etk N-terminal domain-containing protein [Solirubrobacteraceae bacterium]
MGRSDGQPSTYTPALGEGGFEPYVRAVRRHPLLVVAVALAVLLGAGAWLLVRTPRYSATAQVLVTPTPYYDPTYLGLAAVVRDTPGDPFRAAETAATMIDSPSASAATAQRLGGGWTQSKVSAAISVSPMGGTNVLAVEARAAQSGDARSLANTFTAVALAEHTAMLHAQALGLVASLRETLPSATPRIASLRAISDGNDPTFSLLHPAAGRGSVTGPTVRHVLTLALFAGLILGIAVALIADGVIRPRRLPEAAGDSGMGNVATLNPELLEKRRRVEDQTQP